MYSRQLPPIKNRRVGSLGDKPLGRREAGTQPGHDCRRNSGGPHKMPAKPLRRSPLVLDGLTTRGPGRPRGIFPREG